MSISIKNSEEIERMRVAGRLAAEVLEWISPQVHAGISTEQLNQLCHDYIVDEQQAIPAPLNYRGFPKSICTSLNHVVCHGIPSATRILRNGDILNIDVTVIKDDFHGDTSKMFFIGEPAIHMRRIVDYTYDAMCAGIRMVRSGVRLGDIGHAIQSIAEGAGYSVVRDFCGHGIGREFHEDPVVLHYGIPGKGDELLPGMTFTIEPMLNLGSRDVKIMPDGWTVITKDRKPSAQWEHTVLVTEQGYEVLTLRTGEAI
ncbi:MAG: type I methionyl aminopeptidase [Candidatus Eutrophobiaceae bacterium]